MSTITGDANDNILNGTTSDDTIDGLSGNDTIYGDDGNDTISGGDGNDLIDGGAGSDIIDAGDGDDIVVYDSADDLANISGGNGTDMILFTNGDWFEFDFAAHGFELIGERYMDGTDEVTDVYDTNFFLLEERRVHDNGYYTVTVFDYYELETWSQWIREYDNLGNLINEQYIADEGTGTGNTAPEVYAGVTEDLVLVTSGNLFADYTGPNPVLTTFAGQPVPATGTLVINGTYGTLEIDAAGNWTYTLNNPSVQHFTTDDRIPDTFAFEFNDDFGSYFTDLIVEITGNNDAPIATNNTAAVQKDTTLVDSGNVLTDDDGFGVDYDVENQPIGIIDVNGTGLQPSGDTVIIGAYGTLTINGATGAYTYTLDNNNLTVQALDANETIIDSFTYTVTDAAATDTANLDVTILGTASGPQTVPDTATTHEDDTVGVTGNVLDNDAGLDLFVASVDGTTIATTGSTVVTGTYGSLTIDASGNFTFLVDGASATVQALKAGQTLSETFTYTAENPYGTEISNLTISINGANDAAVVGGDDTAQVSEDVGNPPLDLGILTVNDVDAGESSFAEGTYLGTYGTVQLTAPGSYTYSLNNVHPAVQALPQGVTLSDTVTIQTLDGTEHDIMVTITGTNDAAVIGGVNTGSVTEEDDPATLTSGGTLTISDVDMGEAVFTAATHTGSYGSLTIDAAGNWAYSADNTQTAIQQLGLGDTVTDTITITSADGTQRNIVITINGTNDAAVIGGVDTGTVTEEDDPVTLTTTGTLTITDVDAGQDIFSATSYAGIYGSLSIDEAGYWTYSASNTQTAIQELGAGLTLTDTITVASVDGTTHDVTVTIIGINDAAVIGGDDQGSVTEDATTPTITDSGTLTITDVDLNEASFQVQSLSGTYGGLNIDTAGNWSYAAFTDQPAIQALGIGATLIDSFTVSALDGTTHVVDVVINGANDAAVIGGADTGGVTEDGGALQTSTGTLTISDVDAGEDLFTAATVAGSHGSLTIDAAGVWTYTLDNADPAVQALPAGATMNDIVTVFSIDGTTHDITITITGTNDAAVISGDDQANVLEDDTEPVVIPTDPNQPAPPPNIDITDSGTLTITDTDTGEASFAAGTSTGTYGSITIDAAGNWTYTADTTQAAIQQLGTGETLTDTVTISASDGTTHHIAAVITGVNDAPVGAYDSTGDVSNTVDTLILISSILANDTDVEGDAFILTGIEGQPIAPGGQVSVNHGTITMSLDGTTLIFSPEIGYVGPTSFTYVVSDGESDGTGTVALNLSAAAIDDVLTVAEDSSGTVDVLNNDGIVPETVTSFVITSGPASGTIVINPDQTVTYTPDADYNGSDQFTYEFTGMQRGLQFQFFDTVPNNDSVFNIPGGGEEAAGTVQNFDVRALALQYQGDHETYAVRYEGNLYVATAGTYTFRVGSDDGGALRIDGSTVVNNDGLHAYQVHSGSVFLTAGYHDIEVLFFERTGEDRLTVTIEGADTGGVQTDLFASGMVGHSMRTDTATVDVTVTPVNDAAVIGGTDTGTITEDSGPSTLVASGTLTISDADGSSQEAFVAGVTGGSYGNLTIDAIGNWTYEALNDHPAINALVSGQTLTETITVSSVDATTHQVTITINGANDAAVIGGVDTGTVQEDAGAAEVATGTLSVSDPDAGQSSMTAATVAGAHGSLDIDAAGNWTYTLNNADPAVQALGEDQSLQDIVTVTSADGTSHAITLTITGTNDAAVIGGDDQGSVTEDATTPTITDSGILTISDVDTGEALFTAATNTGTYGSVTIDAAGNWTYSADTTQAAIQALGVGATLTDTVMVSAVDGTTHQVTITINGTNDGPVAIADILTASEDGPAATSNVLTDGLDTDIEGDTLTISAVNGEAQNVGAAITLASGAQVTVNGDGSYSYDANGAFEYLAAGETAIDTFEYTVSDGNGGLDTTTVTITINGANDAAVVSGQDTGGGSAAGAGAEITVTGQLTVDDPDHSQSSFAAGTIGGQYGNLVIDDTGAWTYAALTDHPAIAALTADQTLTDTITVTTYDGTTHDVTITIAGANEAPVAFDNTASIIEDAGDPQTGNLILDDNGLGVDTDADGDVLSVTDVDGTAVPEIADATVVGQYGSLIIAANGAWEYAVDSANPFVAGLATGETLIETFTYTVSDGIETSTASLLVTVNGVSEADQALTGDETTNTIHAAGGNDSVDAYGGDDTIYGHGGNDGLNGGAGSDTIYGGSGLDFIYGETGTDYLYGGDDTDAIFAGYDDDFAWGEAGGDSLDGGFGNDELHGGDGIDWLYGSFGDDTLYGDADGDALFGQEGNDTLYGGTGGDSLDGGDGIDTLYGEDGVDWMFGGNDNDTLYGGADTDALFGEAGDDNLYGGDGGDSLDGGIGNDNLFGEAGVDWLFGGAGNDLLVGGGDTDVLFGNDGNDRLQGGDIGDSLDGGAGDDILDGGEGIDVLYGDTGADIFFVFNQAQGGDVIRDFFTGEDKLYVDPLGMGLDASYSGQISQSMFSSGEGLPATLGTGPQFYLETGGQGLWFDPTGEGTGDMFIVAGFETGVPQWSDIWFENPWLA